MLTGTYDLRYSPHYPLDAFANTFICAFIGASTGAFTHVFTLGVLSADPTEALKTE